MMHSHHAALWSASYDDRDIGDGNLRIFGDLPKPGFRHGKDIGECAKAVSKTNLGRRLLS